MNITPEMLAPLPPELRREMQRRAEALFAELDVRPMITPDGQKVFDLSQVADVLGIPADDAMAVAGEDDGGLVVVDPATLGLLQ